MNLSLRSPLGRFRLVAFLEGCSYLLLGLTMILKYRYEMPAPNYVVGMAHGILFMLYVLLLFQVARLHKWSIITFLLAFLASLVPFGTFVAEVKIFKPYAH